MKRPLVLTILDGFGIAPEGKGNAINAKTTPNIDKIFKSNPTTQIHASGMDVGLPEGQMGNSEVGHTNIGAGRIVYQELTRISKSIKDGDFFENPAFLGAAENCKRNGSALHVMGLLSDGGVHSHNTHLYGLLDFAKKQGLEKVYIHCFMDGRDVPPTSGENYVDELIKVTAEKNIGKIATISGRYYAMDREKRFERVKRVYDAMVFGEGIRAFAADVCRESYKNDITDEFIVPTVCEENATVKNGDSVIFFNFRPDRAREITRAFVDPRFDGFERPEFLNLYYVCMTQYDATMPNVEIAYKPQSLDLPLGAIVSQHGLTQLRIAEYTKYAHVTFFLNGGVETIYSGEDRILIDSPDVATYDLKPEMSAYEVCDTVCEKITARCYDFIVINFANCDMVGHTGVYEAAEKAVIAVDECVQKVYEAVKSVDGIMVITADHGNAEKMLEPDGVSPFTAHTTNVVPFSVVNYPCKLKETGRLADIAPTVLEILSIDKPSVMDGESLISKE
ncbi:MAG: 2,3-bisphosphoglycerate-independent phosphoglycerate mutase [Clostridia bacterium]|nr:2,3-bisphosphoglycerate-independent phosphoglycerate mutase [Clostridia bacterium]